MSGMPLLGAPLSFLLVASVAQASISPLPVTPPSDSGRVKVVVRAEHRPLAGAEVRSALARVVRTDATGTARLHLPAGPATLVVARPGYRPDTLHLAVVADSEITAAVELEEQAEELTNVVVTASRVSHLVEDDPTRVEVLAGEEIEEKTQTKPSNLMSLLREMSGVRVQATSPAYGAASIRMQGLEGQYTQVLTDGLPLLGSQVGDLGLAQIPPLDLRQAEVIKGPATALYGPSALGGVVNLVSRAPTNEQDFVLNQTSQSGSDGLAWLSKRLGDSWGVTFLGGAHSQTAQDVDGDGWRDIPGYKRIEVRPRIYYTPGRASLFATFGATTENRDGGTVPGAVVADGQPFPTDVNTNRVDGGLIGTLPLGRRDTLAIRGSATSQWQRQDLGSYEQHGRNTTYFSEATLTIPRGRTTWLVGTGFEQDEFISSDVSGFDYRFTTPSLFAQATVALSPRAAFTFSGRCDWQNKYGTYCNPRASLLVRPGAWAMRLSGATGFFAPTPFIDETDGVMLSRLVPFTSTTVQTCGTTLCAHDTNPDVTAEAPFGILPERAGYGSLDITHRAGPLDVTGTLFASTIHYPLILRPNANIFDERPRLMNASGPTRTGGGELFAVYAHESIVLLVEYAYVLSTAISPLTGIRVDAPLTPRHSGGVDLAWEGEESGTRAALEVFYTGSQALQEDPYRQTSVPYVTVGLLFSQRIGKGQLYVSGQNLLDVRQTKYDPLLLPAPDEEGRWTTEQWAPLEGRVINAGMRFTF